MKKEYINLDEVVKRYGDNLSKEDFEKLASNWLDKEMDKHKEQLDKAFYDYITFGECRIIINNGK